MDVIIIVFFAVAVAVASALINATGFDGLFVVALLVDLGAAVVVGLAVGKLLEAVLNSALGRWPKIGVVLLVGYAIFAAAYWVADYTHTSFPIEIHAEPLSAAMIAGFYITNYTRHREEFADLLHDIGPAYLCGLFHPHGRGHQARYSVGYVAHRHCPFPDPRVGHWHRLVRGWSCGGKRPKCNGMHGWD